MRKSFFYSSLIALSFSANGQDCETVYVSGRAYDELAPQGFYNLMVVNKSEQRGVFGRPNGMFTIYANPGDTLAISVKGYSSSVFTVVADSNCQQKIELELIGKVQESETVIIYPLKSLKQIKEERESLSMRETRTVSGVDAFQSPITALYERFSKTAKSKQLVAAMEYRDNLNQVLKELLRVYVSQDVVNLKEENFEDFINFLNIDEAFLKTASDYELVIFIKDKLEHFKFLNPGLFKDEE